MATWLKAGTAAAQRIVISGRSGGVDRIRYGIVAIASGNGAPRDPAWYVNLKARPIATVEIGPDKFKVRARTARPDERDQLKQVIPYLEQQQSLTAREIPIVVFDRS